MKSNELIDIIDSLDENLGNDFITNTDSKMKIITNAESIQFDYSWLEMIEDSIEALDNIVRNPRKFIVQEEEVVPVAKAKKITLETVKHLAQHTNLIQDVAEDGTITPISVLNVHKEESYDIYENRFINSLLKNLYGFIEDMKQKSPGGSYSKCERKLSFEGTTKLKNENIKITLNMETDYFEDLVKADPSGLSLDTRIDRVEMIVSDFMKSSFIRELANALPVRSPIRKTNVILKEQNFKKALELWEFVEKYRIVEPVEARENSKVEKNKSIEEKFDLTYFMNYALLSSLSTGNKKETANKIDKSYIKKIIENYVNNNKSLDSKTFKQFVNKEFITAISKKKTRQKTIISKLKSSINDYEDKLKDCALLLK